MIFFKSKQKVATEAAIGALRPLVALAQQSGGMSLRMWQDPYLLGFMQMTASFYVKAATAGKAKPHQQGFALIDAFTAVSNMNGRAIASRAIDFGQVRDAEFESGMSDALTVALYTTELLDDESSDSLVDECRRIAMSDVGQALGADERTATAGAMIEKTFLGRVNEMRGETNA